MLRGQRGAVRDYRARYDDSETRSSGGTPVKRYQTTKHGCKAGSGRAACTTDRLNDTEVMSGETKPAWHSARSCLKRLNGWVTNCLSRSVS